MSEKKGFDRWMQYAKMQNTSTSTPSPSSFQKKAEKTEKLRKIENFTRKHIKAQRKRHYLPNPFIKESPGSRRSRKSHSPSFGSRRSRKSRSASPASQTWRSVSSKENTPPPKKMPLPTQYKTNYFDVVLRMGSKFNDYKTLYRKLSIEYHPDKCKRQHPELTNEQCNEITKKINSDFAEIKTRYGM
jgi:hypothetical protein